MDIRCENEHCSFVYFRNRRKEPTTTTVADRVAQKTNTYGQQAGGQPTDYNSNAVSSIEAPTRTAPVKPTLRPRPPAVPVRPLPSVSATVAFEQANYGRPDISKPSAPPPPPPKPKPANVANAAPWAGRTVDDEGAIQIQPTRTAPSRPIGYTNT